MPRIKYRYYQFQALVRVVAHYKRRPLDNHGDCGMGKQYVSIALLGLTLKRPILHQFCLVMVRRADLKLCSRLPPKRFISVNAKVSPASFGGVTIFPSNPIQPVYLFYRLRNMRFPHRSGPGYFRGRRWIVDSSKVISRPIWKCLCDTL